MRKGNYWVKGVLAAVVIFCVGAILLPVTSGGRPMGPQLRCLSQVKRLSISLSMYVADFDDRFPPTDHWNEVIVPYTRADDLFDCPEGGKGVRYGYAMHRSLSLIKLASIEDPAARPAIFDSVIRRANAVGDESYLPRPGRHDGVNIVGYVDGHAKRIRNE